MVARLLSSWAMALVVVAGVWSPIANAQDSDESETTTWIGLIDYEKDDTGQVKIGLSEETDGSSKNFVLSRASEARLNLGAKLAPDGTLVVAIKRMILVAEHTGLTEFAIVGLQVGGQVDIPGDVESAVQWEQLGVTTTILSSVKQLVLVDAVLTIKNPGDEGSLALVVSCENCHNPFLCS